ncbi:hypothetical protein H8356DRAFT_1339527 [Neocallimastix lanati (nom. inval.)]|nr:hypothetical protein H8356DRAFT_1339527 [Neocallimastix sp. JGI-2020a]
MKNENLKRNFKRYEFRKWKDTIKKELQNLYGNNDMKIDGKNKKKYSKKGIKTTQCNGIYKARLIVSEEVFDKIKGVDYTYLKENTPSVFY